MLNNVEKYIKEIKVNVKEIKTTLNEEGLEYGNTRKGASKLAVFAAERYKQTQNREFPRPTKEGWNSVAKEIYAHCNWALGKGLGKIPFVKMRANPINIRTRDKPPLWH